MKDAISPVIKKSLLYKSIIKKSLLYKSICSLKSHLFKIYHQKVYQKVLFIQNLSSRSHFNLNLSVTINYKTD
jgi:hypothetical protein